MKFIANLLSRDSVKCFFSSQRKLNLSYGSAAIGAAAIAHFSGVLAGFAAKTTYNRITLVLEAVTLKTFCSYT